MLARQRADCAWLRERPCALQLSAARALAARIGVKKARVALARKLAVLLHHLRQEDFRSAPA